MKNLIIISLSLLSLNIYALEVGDQAISAPLRERLVDGTYKTRQLLEGDKDFIMLEFMSINCKYCKKNMPLIFEFTKEIKDKVAVKLISIDRGISQVEAFIDDYQEMINYGFVFDNKRKMKSSYNIIYVPAIFLIDKNGQILYKHIGTLKPEIREEIKSFIQ